MPDILDSIPTADNLIVWIMTHIFRTSNRPTDPKHQDNKLYLLIALFAALFLVVATEPYKVIMRKNIGKQALSMLGITAASILYIGWAGIIGIILYSTNYGGSDINEYSVYVQYLCNQYILISGIACYVIFAVYILVRGVNEYFHNSADENDDVLSIPFRGNSVIMGHLINQGWTQNKIWRTAEPRACFRFGLILTIIHPIIGLPLFLTSISFWVNEWYHVSFKWERLQQAYKQMNAQAQMAGFIYNQNNPRQGSTAVNDIS